MLIGLIVVCAPANKVSSFFCGGSGGVQTLHIFQENKPRHKENLIIKWKFFNTQSQFQLPNEFSIELS